MYELKMSNLYKNCICQYILVKLAKISYFLKKIACFVNQDGRQAAILKYELKKTFNIVFTKIE